jgi:carbon monoxide dehydrogenase subunit G
MKLEQSFEVAAPLERVWQALIDVEHVAPCLPGAGITGRNEDGSYAGTFKVKIGPTTASYTGKLEMRDIDESAHTATMEAHGNDKRGQGGATATIKSRLESLEAGRTRVEVDTDYHITGRLARFGRGGMIEDISARLLTEFATRLQQSLEGPGGAARAAAPVEEPLPEEAAAPGAEASAAPAAEESGQPAPEPPAPSEPPPPPGPPPPPRTPPPPSEPIQGASLAGSVVADRIRANPWPLLAIGFVLGWILRGRR